MRWILCKLLGHRYTPTHVNARKAANLCHLHPLAGFKATCDRCGHVWDDLWSPVFAFGDEIRELPPSAQPLPTARVV